MQVLERQAKQGFEITLSYEIVNHASRNSEATESWENVHASQFAGSLGQRADSPQAGRAVVNERECDQVSGRGRQEINFGVALVCPCEFGGIESSYP